MLDFIRSIPTGVVDWKLRWRDGTPQWTSDSGRLVRLGDAAHAFLPTAGNGAVQALEDAVSLAECLRIAGKKGVCHATKVHNKLRLVSKIFHCVLSSGAELWWTRGVWKGLVK